jgi:hypothetical protein
MFFCTVTPFIVWKKPNISENILPLPSGSNSKPSKFGILFILEDEGDMIL